MSIQFKKKYLISDFFSWTWQYSKKPAAIIVDGSIEIANGSLFNASNGNIFYLGVKSYAAGKKRKN